jgi:chromosomal replication initiator protein
LTASEREVVASLGQAIAQRIGEPRYNLWFARNTKFTWTDDQLVVGVPNHFYQEWLQSTFADAVHAAALEVLGRTLQVRFVIDPVLFQAARKAQAEIEAAPSGGGSGKLPSEREQRKPVAAGSSPPPIPRSQGHPGNEGRAGNKSTRRWLRLSDFVVGPCNRVAHASAVSLVEAPGQGVNPLVLHGPVGTGKTHLLEGIYAGLRKHQPDARVCYVTAEDFTNRFVQALRFGKLGVFRKQFRECDALLVDDLDFLTTRKQATQEEFLHTFDTLLANGKQLVVTCDCHPRLTDTFSPELTDRLLGGAVWGLAPPDPETRLAILRAKSRRAQPLIPDEVLRYLATQLRGNVRELEGALYSVQHFGRVAARPIDLALAREALGDLLRHAIRVVQLPDIDRAVCHVLHLDAGSLQSKQRAWFVSHPRMLAMYLARKHTAAAYSEIGRHFGGRNHSTVVAAEKKIRQWLQEDAALVLGQRHLRVQEMVELVERELLR